MKITSEDYKCCRMLLPEVMMTSDDNNSCDNNNVDNNSWDNNSGDSYNGDVKLSDGDK